MKMVSSLYVLECFAVLGICHVTGFFTGTNQCFKFTPQYSCNKLSSSSDCDTVHTKRVCMGVRLGFGGECFNVCSYPLPQKCYCDPALTSAESCENGLICKPNCIKIFNFMPFCKYECEPADIGQDCSADSMKWTKIYQSDGNGVPLGDFDIEALAEAVRRGAEVKVYTEAYGLMTLQKASVHVNEDGELNVYGQGLHWSRPPTTISYYYVFSTEGNVHISAFDVGDEVVSNRRDNVNFGHEITWFVRESNVLVTDESTVKRFIQDGASVRVSLDEEEFMDLEAVSYEPVEGETVWEMRDILYGREFNVTEQWVFRTVGIDDQVETSTWRMNTHDMQMHQTEERDVGWFVDTCWELVYRHDEAGQAVYGTYEDLVEAIQAGNRVQVRIDGVLHEANVVTIRDEGEVVLHVYDNIDSDLGDVTWRYLYVSTNGSVTSVDSKLGADNNTETTTVENKEVFWFVEQRNWTVGALINESGAALDGTDKETLVAAFDGGADFRYMIEEDGDQIYYEADLVTKTGSELRVFTDREVILDDTGSEYVRGYSFLDTTGVLNYDDYLVEQTQRSATGSESGTVSTWFIGY